MIKEKKMHKPRAIQVAKYIVTKYGKQSDIRLHCILYYIQAHSFHNWVCEYKKKKFRFFKDKIFKQRWAPVIFEVWDMGRTKCIKRKKHFSHIVDFDFTEKQIKDMDWVMKTYADQFEGDYLPDTVIDELAWKKTESRCEITPKTMIRYRPH